MAKESAVAKPAPSATVANSSSASATTPVSRTRMPFACVSPSALASRRSSADALAPGVSEE